VLAGFLRVEAGASAPMMPLGLFRSVAFSGANGMPLLLYFALGRVQFLLPFNLIGVQDYSATLARAAFLPFTAVVAGLSRWAGGPSAIGFANKLQRFAFGLERKPL
jgi:hypothetical protein